MPKPMTCELCGRDDTEVDLGDFNGTVACYECADKEPELKSWLERTNRELGFGLGGANGEA